MSNGPFVERAIYAACHVQDNAFRTGLTVVINKFYVCHTTATRSYGSTARTAWRSQGWTRCMQWPTRVTGASPYRAMAAAVHRAEARIGAETHA